MDAVLVRPVSHADHSALAALFASAGMPPTAMVSSHDCCVASLGPPERVIGYGAWWHSRLDKFRMDLLVAEQWRRQGVGTRLLSHVVSQAQEAGAVTLQARVDSNNHESLAFLVGRGFAETMRMHTLVLDVAEVDLAAHVHILARLAARGVVLTSLEQELKRGEVFWTEFCPLYNAAHEGWPDPDPGPVTPRTPAELRDRHYAAAQEHRVGIEQCFLAACGDRYVGFTGALGTAVHPAFRGQGIATALKLRAIMAARDHAIATLDTSTGNPAMVRANERLGFRLVSTEVRLVRTLPAVARPVMSVP